MSDELNKEEFDGNFNEVEPEGDNTDGNFNEVEAEELAEENNLTETEPPEEENETEIPEMVSKEETDSTASAVPSQAPAKQGNQKAILGVVIALGIVIVGLIIFLVVMVINNQKEKNNNNTPTGTESSASAGNTETIEITPDISDAETTKTPDEDGEGVTAEPEPTEIPTFDVTCEVGEYRGLKVDYTVAEVTDEEVQKALDYFVSSCEEDVDITDRPIKEGDQLVIDYVGTMDGEEFQGGTASDVSIVLGSAGYIDGFESGLVGKNVGDTVSLDLTFPDPYTVSPEKAGKPVNFKVTIKEATVHMVYELSDELVAENSEYSTVEEYKNAAREKLHEQNVQSAENKKMEDLIKQVIAGSTFSGQIDEQIEYEEKAQLEYNDSQFEGMGFDAATYYSYVMGITTEDYYSLIHEQIEMSIKYGYCLEEIAKKEGYTVSQEDFDKMFEEIFFTTYGFTSKEEVYAEIPEEEVKTYIDRYVISEKAEQLIIDTAVINNN